MSPDPFNGERKIFPVVFPPIVNVLFCVVWISPVPFLKESDPDTDAVPRTSKNAVGTFVPTPTRPVPSGSRERF